MGRFDSSHLMTNACHCERSEAIPCIVKARLLRREKSTPRNDNYSVVAS